MKPTNNAGTMFQPERKGEEMELLEYRIKATVDEAQGDKLFDDDLDQVFRAINRDALLAKSLQAVRTHLQRLFPAEWEVEITLGTD